jgi:ATP-dependent protease ClpP protease subunit
MTTNRFRMASPDRAEVMIYGDIGAGFFFDGVTAEDIHAAIGALAPGAAIDLRINSFGGHVHEGIAMHTLLARHEGKVTAHIDGVAASAATIPAMAADEIVIARGGTMMIHEASGGAMGRAHELRAAAEGTELHNKQMADLYAARTGQSVDEIRAAMAKTTWYGTDAAIEVGLADRIGDREAATATMPERFRAVYAHIPATMLAPATKASEESMSAESMSAERIAELEKALAEERAARETAVAAATAAERRAATAEQSSKQLAEDHRRQAVDAKLGRLVSDGKLSATSALYNVLHREGMQEGPERIDALAADLQASGPLGPSQIPPGAKPGPTEKKKTWEYPRDRAEFNATFHKHAPPALRAMVEEFMAVSSGNTSEHATCMGLQQPVNGVSALAQLLEQDGYEPVTLERRSR